jgi:hypothetical protein
MRDPYNIPRPQMFPMRNPCIGTSQDYGKLTAVHAHRAYPDAQGNGNTDIVAAHYHRIVEGRLLPDQSDSHTHQLFYNLPCGAGI